MRRPSLGLLLPLSLVITLGSLSGADAAPRASNTYTSADNLAGSLSITDARLHRRAADLLEEQRHREGSSWVDARVNPDPVALFRPGEDQPAYAEFSIEGAGGEARGFLVLSTGEHDAPLVHASQEGESPSARLRKMADGENPARFFRLGHTYVAEDADQELLAVVGELPHEMLGYEARWRQLDASDRAGRSRGGDIEPSPVGAELRFERWGDWSRIRSEYAANRAPLHTRDREAAAAAWAFESWWAENGETLKTGEFRELPLLDRGAARVRVRGAGAPYVHTRVENRPLEGDRAVTVFVDGVPQDSVLPVDIELAYADGSSETLRLNVADQMPSHLLGFAAPSASGGSVAVKITPLVAPGVQCKKVILRANGQGFVRMDGNQMKATGTEMSQAARLRIDHLGGGRVTLRAPSGKYFEARGGGGGDVTATAIGPTRDATFRMFENQFSKDGQIGFRTNTNRHFIATQPGGRIDARNRKSEWSRYELAACEPTRSSAYWAGSSYSDAWTKTRKYRQLDEHEAPSNSQCSSGCGATAWAMLFGFHDYEAHLRRPKWRELWGLYRENGSKDGADRVAPEWMSDDTAAETRGIKNVIWEISQKMNDWTLAGCSPSGEKWTAPVIMGRAHQYFEGRVNNVTLGSDYDGAMIFTDGGKKKVKDLIRRLKQPVVIGIRDPEHYPLAIGWESSRYRLWDRGKKAWTSRDQRSHFVVHMGHGQLHSDLVPYDSWFQGWLRVAESANSTPAKAANKPATKQKGHAPKPQPAPRPNVKLPKKKKYNGPAPTPKW